MTAAACVYVKEGLFGASSAGPPNAHEVHPDSMPNSEALPSTELMAEASTMPSVAFSLASASWQRLTSAGLNCSIMPTTGSRAAASPAY